MLTPQQTHQIQDFFQHEPVELVYLFGSQATGQTHPNSDYDFAVLFDDKLNSDDRFSKRITYIGQLMDVLKANNIDVVDLNNPELSDYFKYSVIAPRHDLHVKNESTRIDFEQKILSIYFDRLPSLQRHTLASLATISQQGL